MEKKIKDSQLGIILLRTHPRATRYSLKVSHQMVVATMPEKGDEAFMLKFIEQNREKLYSILAKQEERVRILDEQTELTTATFKLHIFRSDRKNFYLSLKEEILHIACPQETDFKDPQVQEVLNKMLTRALRYEANRILPERLKKLAEKHRFTYKEVKIRCTKSRWGSCSSQKNINLSCFLMLLPEPLIDYVLLHELCHTIEMNHSERFWGLMDQVTDNKAYALRRELKKHQML